MLSSLPRLLTVLSVDRLNALIAADCLPEEHLMHDG